MRPCKACNQMVDKAAQFCPGCGCHWPGLTAP